MKTNDCIFCKIIAKEIPSLTLYEDEYFLAILDISPSNKGHALVLPKQHMTNIFEIDDKVASNILPLISKLGAAIQDTLHCDGINIMQNNGTAAGQTVPHLHFHIIPRYEGDQVILPWRTLSYNDGEALELAKQIQHTFQGI